MGLFSNAKKQGIPGRDSVGGMGSAMARPAPPRPTLVQGGPAYFTPEGYRPPMQPEQAFMPTDTMGDPIGDMFRRQLPPVRIPGPPPMKNPPRDPRDDFISIGGVGGNDGIGDPRMEPMPEPPADPRDYMPRMPRNPKEDLIANPAPTPPGMGGGSFGTLGGSGYGRFPLGSAGPEYLYDDDGNPIMEPKFNTTIPGDGTMEDMIPKPPMPPMAPPMMPPVDIDRPIIRGLEDREIMNDFMSIERMDEPRDEFIPRMPNENPVPFIPPVEMSRDMTPIMPPSFERIEEDPRMPLEEPIAMPRNPEMVAEIQRRMALPPMMPTQDPITQPYEMSILKEGTFELPEPDMSGKFTPFTQEVEPMPMMPQLMPEPMPIPMQPRMQMPGPIATPTPRLQRPSLPMMPMMGGRGRR